MRKILQMMLCGILSAGHVTYVNEYADVKQPFIAENNTVALLNTAAMSVTMSAKSEAEEGETLTLTASSSGITGPVTYRFMIKTEGSWNILRDYSPEPSVTWKAEKAGTYPIAVIARGSDLKSVKYQTKIKVVHYDELTVDLEDGFSPAVGYETVINASVSGGKKPYQFRFTMKEGSGSWQTVQNWSESSSFTFTPSEQEICQIAVQAKDARGITVKDQIRLKVTDFEELSGVLKAEDNLRAQKQAVFTAEPGGGTGPYQYRFTIKENGAWTLVQDWSSSPVLKYIFETPGDYQMAVKIKDSAGRTYTAKCKVTVAESQPLSIQPVYPAKVYTGRPFTLSVKADGGYGAYEYRVTRKNGDVWEEYQPYSENASITITEYFRGTCKYCIYVKDGSGTVEKKVISVKVIEQSASPQACPVSITSSIFVNRTAQDVISYYGSENCKWNVISYDNEDTNPKNYMGVAKYERTSETSADLYMYVRW